MFNNNNSLKNSRLAKNGKKLFFVKNKEELFQILGSKNKKPYFIFYDGKYYQLFNFVNDLNNFYYAPSFVSKYNLKQKKQYEILVKSLSVFNNNNQNFLQKLQKKNFNKFIENKKILEKKKIQRTNRRFLKYYLYLTPALNNYFVTLNTNYSKLIFKTSTGFFSPTQQEKLSFPTIQKLANKVITFLIQNKIFRFCVSIKTKPLKFTKKICTMLKKARVLKPYFFKVIRFAHSKGLKGKKRRRV